MLFIFDGGTLSTDMLAQVQFQDGEIDRYDFVTIDQLPELTIDRLTHPRPRLRPGDPFVLKGMYVPGEYLRRALNDGSLRAGARYFRIVFRSTPSDIATSLIERPAYQWMKISVTSTTSNVLLAIGSLTRRPDEGGR